MSERQDELAPSVLAAVRSLHDAPLPEINDVWRQRLLRRIAAGDYPRDHPARHDATPRRWSVKPSSAVAAGVLCMLFGGVAVFVAERAARHDDSPSLASSPSTEASFAGASEVRFTLVAPAAQRVSVVGDFNGWNAASLPMRRSADGHTWEIVVPLRPGRYAYSFVVDGVLARDPLAPSVADDDFGSANSVVLVRGS